MNRKLVNGLLLVALASSGCGMFTSCKDTDDDMYNQVVVGVADLEKQLADVKAELAKLPETYVDWNTYNAKVQSIETELGKKATKEELQALKKELDALQANVEYALSSIKDTLTKLITDINLNQTWNPMFGSINLPVGLTSTITANYYGLSKHAVEFPGDANIEVVRDADGANQGVAKIAALNPTTVKFDANTPYMDTDEEGLASLGYLYLSVNPTTIDPSAYTFSLVNSKDEEAAVEAIELNDTEKELMFGINPKTTRNANGLYEAEIKVKPENAGDLAINFDKEALKSAVKNLLDDKSKSDFVTLAKVMMDQMTDLMPAYAIKATWETKDMDAAPSIADDGTVTDPTATTPNTYIGKYEIAAATVNPLGYSFMKDFGTSKKLPTFGSLQEVLNKVFDEINVTIDDITFNPEKMEITINLGEAIQAGADADVTIADKLILTYSKDGKVETVKTEGGKVVTNVGALNDLVGQINSALANVSSQINTSIGDAIKNIQNSLSGKLSKFDSLVSKYNSLANRINNFLAHPNDYVQVYMAYEGVDGQLHALSASKALPTPVAIDGAAADAAIVLYPTSYTAGIIAPSCKKFVAVTEVTGSSNSNAAKDINETEYLNEVISGAQQEVVIPVSKLEKGCTYEIVYSSLDYQGYTSTRTFYFVAK